MKLFNYFIAVFFLLSSCERYDEFEDGGIGDQGAHKVVVPDNSVQEFQDELIGQLVTSQRLLSSVFININTPEGSGIDGASVTISGITKTSENGFVFFMDVPLNQEYVGIKIEKEGYVSTIKNVTPSSTKNNILTVTLFEGETHLVDGEVGGEINFESGVSLVFPESSVVNSDGTDYVDDLTVRLYYHKNTDASYLEGLPGALVGLDKGKLSSLVTEGIISVDLLSSSGTEVFIKDGKTVLVTMPANENEPDEIVLWHLNENYGIWISTGVAVKKGTAYEFEVSHFSSYNLAYTGIDVIDFTFTVVTGNDIITGQQFYLYINGINNKLITTDDNGQFILYNAPKGDYHLVPVLCVGNLISETRNITQSGDYKIDIPNYNDHIARFGESYSFSGRIRNCDNYDSALFFIEGVGNSERTNLNELGVFYFDINSCANLVFENTIEVSVVFYKGENTVYAQSYNFDFLNDDYSVNSQVDVEGCDIDEKIDIDIDSVLLAQLKESLGLSRYEALTVDYARTIERLDICGNSPSIDLVDFVNYFPNISYLYSCTGNEILNFDEISKLVKLEKLYIGNNSITDISGLSSLHKLTRLDLGGNSITDISGLSSLQNLTSLLLHSNPVADISGLSGLTRLRSLTLSDTLIVDISVLMNLLDLNKLDLNLNSITDISGLSSLSNLTYLSLAENPLTREQVNELREQLPNTSIYFY